MGLDMYLSASWYIGGWDHTPPVEKDLFTKLTLLLNTTPTSKTLISRIVRVGSARESFAAFGGSNSSLAP